MSKRRASAVDRTLPLPFDRPTPAPPAKAPAPTFVDAACGNCGAIFSVMPTRDGVIPRTCPKCRSRLARHASSRRGA